MIAIIAAVAKNGIIGKNGKIPWNLPEDMKHFRERTTGQTVVMGRCTYEEIGHPLPDRMNYLLSSTLHIETENCHTVTSLTEVMEREQEENRSAAEKQRDIFICGGRRLYEEALPLADTLYLTELTYPVEGDTFFPTWDRTEFLLVKKTAGSPHMWFAEYKRR